MPSAVGQEALVGFVFDEEGIAALVLSEGEFGEAVQALDVVVIIAVPASVLEHGMFGVTQFAYWFLEEGGVGGQFLDSVFR